MKEKILFSMIGFLLATTIFCAVGWNNTSHITYTQEKNIQDIRNAICGSDVKLQNGVIVSVGGLTEQLESIKKNIELLKKEFCEPTPNTLGFRYECRTK